MREIKFRFIWKKYGKTEHIEYLTLAEMLRIDVGRDLNRLEVYQYTGLKDKKGKEIYFDCSIIKPRGMRKPYILQWNDWFVLNNIESKPELYEIIGNIYENPELLT